MPVPATHKTEAALVEVFSSIQGEGILVGCRQIFIRFAHCNLACAYCDTKYAVPVNCRIEDAPGSEQFVSVPNPVPLETLYNIIYRWVHDNPGAHHSISITGGEPLVQADELAEWLPVFRKLLPIYLETNGTLTDALVTVLPYVDFISMDLKIPSQTGFSPKWDAHRQFLTHARGSNCFVKAVVGADTTREELQQAARLVHDVAPEVTLVLQPVTTREGIETTTLDLMVLQKRVAEIHPLVRIIPQTHRFMGLL